MTALDSFLGLREQLRDQRIGDGGVVTSRALTKALDDALTDLAADLSGEPVALLAVGGYGRREQCINSDVDLTILHAGADLDALARRILYPLWDAGLKVGHAFRTIGESNAAGRERLDTLTSQLSARLIAGNEDLFAEYLAGLIKTLTGRPLVPELAAMEAERREIHPYQVMAADVKKGRGALRTFQGFWWDRRRSQLLGLGEGVELDAEREAFDVLLRVRNGLHAVSGRALDVYAFDAREPVARWLGSDVMTVSELLCGALALGDRLAVQRWPGLTTSGRRARSRFRALRLTPKLPPAGTLARAVSLMDQPDLVRSAAVESGSHHWPETERDAFVRLISAGPRGRMAFVQLQQTGWVEREFPEWRAVDALPQLAPFHEHPADAHLWRTADEMALLLDDEDPFRSELVAGLGADEELLLSAFLHDIGKGRGGDHSVLGAEAARSFLSRVGYRPSTTEAVSKSILHHLLLIRTATRRDIADTAILDDIADEIGDVRLLQVLYLLTIADTKATGVHMWSDWKETLLTQLYMRVAERMSGRRAATHVNADEIAGLSQEGVPVDAVEAHLAGLPDDYVQFMSAADIAWHLDNLVNLSDDHTSLSVDRSGQRVLALGRDRRGFLLAVCRAFAAHGVGIHDARIYTRNDKIAIDTFHVLDDRDGRTVADHVWPEVAHTLEEIEASGLDVSPRVRHRDEAYAPRATSHVRVAVRPDLSTRHLALEVRSPDRIGLLADLVSVLYVEGLDLQLARIDTRGTEAIDILYLDRETSPSSDEELEALCRRIEQGASSD